VHCEGDVSCSGVQRVEGFDERLTCRLVHLFVLRLWRACCVFGSFAQRRGTGRSSTMRTPLSRRVPQGNRESRGVAPEGPQARRIDSGVPRGVRAEGTTGTARHGRAAKPSRRGERET
jgi:hypothetical protein